MNERDRGGQWIKGREPLAVISQRVDALDVLVARLVHIVGQLKPGAFDYLGGYPEREVPPNLETYQEEVAYLIRFIAEREREKLETVKMEGQNKEPPKE